MGWIVWFLDTALCIAAAYLVAVATYPDRGTLNRLVVTLLVTPALILLDIQACGIAGHLEGGPLTLVGGVLFGGVGAIAFRAAGLAAVRTTLRSDLTAPWRLVADVWGEKEPAILTLAPAGMALFVVCQMVWYFKSWTWDPVWYHVPITSYVIQNRSLDWFDTHELFTQGYARNVELLAAWNCVFQHDNRLDDSSQLPFAILGVCVLAAWARRLGSSRPMALAVGAAWYALPPVFLESHSTHVDVAVGALFPAAMYFASAAPERRDRWMCFIAMGLYVGSKFTGVLHLGLLAPWLLGRSIYEVWKAPGRRLRVAGDVVSSLVGFAAIGLHKYVQNLVHTRNPFWPFRTVVPVVHYVFPGPMEVGSLWALPSGVTPEFFGAPGDFTHMLNSWFDDTPFYAPDVRSGGFGVLFRWCLLPAMAAVACDVVRLRDWRRGLPIVALFTLGLVVPTAWWPRFIIPSAAASLLALALVHQQIPSRLVRVALSLAFVFFTWKGYRAGVPGFITYPRNFAAAVNATPEVRSALQIDTFLWPTEAGLLRERELRAGDVVTYDESAHFLAEFWCRDYRTRVTFVSSAGEPAGYVRRLRTLHARWVGVSGGSSAETAVREAGGVWLFGAPGSSVQLYRMPRSF